MAQAIRAVRGDDGVSREIGLSLAAGCALAMYLGVTWPAEMAPGDWWLDSIDFPPNVSARPLWDYEPGSGQVVSVNLHLTPPALVIIGGWHESPESPLRPPSGEGWEHLCAEVKLLHRGPICPECGCTDVGSWSKPDGKKDLVSGRKDGAIVLRRCSLCHFAWRSEETA